MTRTYPTIDLAVRAFVRHGKKKGFVRVLGGGWWQVQAGRSFAWRAQGFADLRRKLLAHSVLMQHPGGSATFTEPVVKAATIGEVGTLVVGEQMFLAQLRRQP
jgi:hypothetical protein